MTAYNNHPVQLAALRTLLFTPNKRFAQLQADSGLSSAHLTFHLGKLIEAGLIQKQPTGVYGLTPRGKAFANRSSAASQTLGEQPKLSVLLQVERDKGGRREFLIQQRLKHPHYGFYGRISGKVGYGEPVAKAAERVLHAETGLAVRFNFAALLRKYDYADQSDVLLEDKLFVVMQAREPQGELIANWPGGRNMWMTADEFLSLDPATCFSSARDFMTAPDSLASYSEISDRYKEGEY